MPQATQVWVGTSWKMNKTLAEGLAFAEALAAFVAGPRRAHPALRHPVLHRRARGEARRWPTTRVKVGAQNMHWADAGAWTGEVSPLQLKDCGLDLIELGHRERREHFGETDETVGLQDRGRRPPRLRAADLRRRDPRPNASPAAPTRCSPRRPRRARQARRRAAAQRADPLRLRAGLGDRREGHPRHRRLCRPAARR